MINPDELEPLTTRSKPIDLQGMSVQELEDYIASLEAEIARADAMIAQKKSHLSGAQDLFRKA